MGELVLGRLLPGPPTMVSPTEAYSDPARGPRGRRPWVLVNMIASVDGATAIEGRSGALGAAGDKAVFRAVRAVADVVLVGAGTARAERYGPPAKAGQRIAVVTASGDLRGCEALLASGAAVVVTTADGPAPPDGVPVVRAGAGVVDVVAALAQLADSGARVVVAEGGPRLNGDLVAAGCVDELCVTTAPLVVGGASTRLAHGAIAARLPLRLAHLLADDEGYLYSRWLAEHLPPPPGRLGG